MQDQQSLIQAHGKRLLEYADKRPLHTDVVSDWIRQFLLRLNRYEDFRIRALRFVDLLPALDDDEDVVSLFNEYFSQGEFPMPAFGKVAIRSGRLLGNRVLAGSIKKAVSLLATQYMVSDDPAKMTVAIREIQKTGCSVSLDLLGEITLSHREADRYQSAYLEVLDRLQYSDAKGVQCSIKISSLCPRIDALNLGGNLCHVLQRIRPILLKARDKGIAIALDMEDYEKRPLILETFRVLLFDDAFRDWQGIGLALQSYLTSAAGDVDQIISLSKQRETPFHVRWVRGAYWDQETVIAAQRQWPTPVWSSQAETDIAYEQGLEALMSVCPAIHLNLATHNPRSLALAMAMMQQRGLNKEQVEFQMLYGMAPHYQQALVDLGYPLRVYLPFGKLIPGMAYLVRRLLENASSQSIGRLQQGHESAAAMFNAPQLSLRESHAPKADFINCAGRRFVYQEEREAFQEAIDRTRGQLGRDYPLIIQGRPVETRDKILSVCPSDTELLVGRSASAGEAEADSAIAAATTALRDWQAQSISSRADLLRRAADLLTQRRDRFSALECFEAGKNWHEADADVCEAIDFLNYYADQAETLLQTRRIDLPGEDNRHHYQPKGISLVIPPWNFPLAILTGMLSASLVTGNCVILKPASDTPIVAAQLVELLAEAGLPPGVIGYLPGPGSQVGEYLVRHPAVNLIAFTGSLDVGRRIQRHAAAVGDDQVRFKKVIAEMGGKNAIIVDSSADPDEAVSGILQSAFGFQGQKCSACSRVIVLDSLYERICARLADAAESLIVADPSLPQSEIGPVINRAARERILSTIEQGRRWGTLYHQTDVSSHTAGHYVAPTLFRDVAPDSPLAQEEIFGPVLSLMPAKDLDQALAIANNTRYALTGGFYSRSPVHLKRAAAEFCVGNLYLNRGITGALVHRQPFGGHKMSGIGFKTGGRDYLLQFVEVKSITENTLRRGIAPLS